MKKKCMSILLAAVMCLSCVTFSGVEVKAEDKGENLDFSYLLTDNTLVGTAEMQTRGIYLAEGNSYINALSTTKIGAGGDTIAATKCKVSVTSIVERLVGGSWYRVTSWTATTASGYSASVSKSLTVGTGYYYRVRSTHYASTDSSTSNTSALWMKN